MNLYIAFYKYYCKYFQSLIDKAVEYIKNNPKEAFDEYAKVYKYYVFERVFHLIYGTQINLLEYLASKENNSENKLICRGRTLDIIWL